MTRGKYDGASLTSNDSLYVKVLRNQANAQVALNQRLTEAGRSLDGAIMSSETLLQSLGRPLPAKLSGIQPPVLLSPTAIRPWAEIEAEAKERVSGDVGICDLLTPDEVAQVEAKLSFLRGEFDQTHRLDGIDWCIAGVAGTLGALVDTFLVTMPSSPGMLGAPKTQGGALSDFIRSRLRTAYSPSQISEMEKAFSVPFDAPHSAGLPIRVPGLSPRTHRFQTLGHDPLLGFIFGVADILRGTMTAIDSSGNVIVQAVGRPADGMSLFEALARVFGHLASDIGTPAGLPAPLMPLLQILQVGKFGNGEYTVGQLSRLMYVKGYDFGHFLAMSIPTMIIEGLVRLAYAVKRLIEGRELHDSLPLAISGQPRPPKLQTMLFTAHLIATSVNVGRVAVTKNPLAVNYPEWIMFAKSAIQQLKWTFFEKEAQRLTHVQTKIDEDWDDLNRAMTQAWRLT